MRATCGFPAENTELDRRIAAASLTSRRNWKGELSSSPAQLASRRATCGGCASRRSESRIAALDGNRRIRGRCRRRPGGGSGIGAWAGAMRGAAERSRAARRRAYGGRRGGANRTTPCGGPSGPCQRGGNTKLWSPGISENAYLAAMGSLGVAREASLNQSYLAITPSPASPRRRLSRCARILIASSCRNALGQRSLHSPTINTNMPLNKRPGSCIITSRDPHRTKDQKQDRADQILARRRKSRSTRALSPGPSALRLYDDRQLRSVGRSQ